MSYGELRFEPGPPAKWCVTRLAPHVAVKFKRMFPNVPQSAVEITLSDTDDVRADLEWFLVRYPLEGADRHLLAEGTARLTKRLAERDRILLPDWTPGPLTGFRPGFAPYRYQAQAAAIALKTGALLLGDDVGLGKTITAAAMLTGGAPLPAAIVVQPHLSGQWKAQIERFTTLRVHEITTTKPYSLPEADVYVFRYSNVGSWSDVIAQGLFRTAVYDEIQELRGGLGTNKGVGCQRLSSHAEVRLGLTATPIYNYGSEMFHVMGFVKPDLLGGWHEFALEWCKSTDWKVVKDPDALGSYLRDTGHFLRRTEDDAAVDAAMPPPNVIDFEVPWNDADADAEEELARTLALKVLHSTDFMEKGRAARELDLMMRQLTGVAKARAVATYVRLLLNDCDRVLLAGWHREVYEIWRTELATFDPVLYTGSETAAGKARSIEAFTKGSARVMMISLRSGAGLDGLQHHCRDIVFGELDWSPQVHHQVIGRLRRPGQRDQVTAHYLHTNGGSDPVLLEMLGIKSDQSRGINAPGQLAKARYTDESRIKRLAAFVLGAGDANAEAAA